MYENVRERRRKSRIVRFRDLELVYLHVCVSGKNLIRGLTIYAWSEFSRCL